ncbi:MAG: energy-coupling factor ABC transporter substrate-binding protein [Lentilactobacillus diolivorans]|jgi:cobalt/nickel transport protein|uniref:energy-coupling factor ABC transporter substrate-binding protein n=1 Tax=Lentilactobacillus diolivorans TaxID=179838 RepID=UPI000FEEED13|nr:energy-coupling factor ABC transporter substrate-binding protein [Lentilactobacillus diolivorans]MCH4164730.1 energy-coupling factor ABC transporter substrate-binding protein [Lentilactobacillus diolivorans]MDH5105157.1 energy-coupling factor ABC transporter substrate-binding protein [Lentilactobacillus diolivorans]RRG02491.1 MAG: energy-coupling factor ABC transporter substrate-binding protein [Lactobacillus sp.]
MKKSKTKQNIILLVLVIILVISPFFIVKNGTFSGSDDQGTEQIKKNDPSYKVWAHPLWTPPSGEVESLLFTVQGSLGTGIIAYVIGNARGKKKERERQLREHAEDVSTTQGH